MEFLSREHLDTVFVEGHAFELQLHNLRMLMDLFEKGLSQGQCALKHGVTSSAIFSARTKLTKAMYYGLFKYAGMPVPFNYSSLLVTQMSAQQKPHWIRWTQALINYLVEPKVMPNMPTQEVVRALYFFGSKRELTDSLLEAAEGYVRGMTHQQVRGKYEMTERFQRYGFKQFFVMLYELCVPPACQPYYPLTDSKMPVLVHEFQRRYWLRLIRHIGEQVHLKEQVCHKRPPNSYAPKRTLLKKTRGGAASESSSRRYAA